MTYVINQGLALYWGTSRWSAAEIMVCDSNTHTPNPFLVPFPPDQPIPHCAEKEESGMMALTSVSFPHQPRRPTPWPGSSI